MTEHILRLAQLLGAPELVAASDKEAVGRALARAVAIAKQSDEYSTLVAALMPHVQAVVAWLGRDWAYIESTLDSKRIGQFSPIEVVPYDALWPSFFRQEAELLRAEFGPERILRVEHFGSTAVPGLCAKPVIDMLVQVPSFELVKQVIEPRLIAKAYGSMWSASRPAHIMFAKGYGLSKGKPGEDEAIKYHLHMAPADHPVWDRLLFRDYLRLHAAVAQQYALLKLELARLHRHDREAYTAAKSDFIIRVTAQARMELSS